MPIQPIARRRLNKPRPRYGRWGLLLLLVLTLAGVLTLGGCAEGRYVMQSLRGHWDVMQASRPVEQWLRDETVAPSLKQRLEMTQRMRDFAIRDLALPDNSSYRRYADLRRPAVVWNVVAAPAYSLTPKTWCFPIAGCVAYRGYFFQPNANDQARDLLEQGFETTVYAVPAYSTLGWSNVLGGDPLLNTFVDYPEGELARMIFHELAHQAVYVKDDTEFNESFATAVERLGTQRWMERQAGEQARQVYAQANTRRAQFQALVRATRQRLLSIYTQFPYGTDAGPSLKAKAMEDFRGQYQQLRQDWGGYAGYDAWVAGANNASFAALGAYDQWVPSFEVLFARSGGDWPRFYDAVKHLTRMPKDERTQSLKKLQNTETPGG